MVRLTVDGKTVEVADGATVLDAVRAAGRDLPTLCHHDALAPYGACRLCMVTVAGPPPRLAAACVHPATAGMAVETASAEAVAARKMTLEFLLARCPESDVIRSLAARQGVSATRFAVPPPEGANPLCMLCGLCVRVCNELIGAGAISFVGRGSGRRVGTAFDLHAEACIGCGACAEICPTGAIRMEDRDGRRILHTWNTSVALHTCPGCGQPFVPEATAFLKKMFPEIDTFWALCPACRQKRTAGQWLAAAG